MLTFGDAKNILAQYAGRGGACAAATDLVNQFTLKTLQQMLYAATYGNLRKFCFCAVKGCITLPYELEVPLKVKIEGEVGTVFDKWYEFYNDRDLDCDQPVGKMMAEDGSNYPTVYDVPAGGSRIGVVGICDEAPDANVVVQGLDLTGREIWTTHQGEQIHGEYLSIRKGTIKYTQVTFGTISSIQKTQTNGYVQLYAINLMSGVKTFLADYSPVETSPAYRRFKLNSPRCSSNLKVSVLGRIRLKPAYLDNDLIPFDNLYAIELAGQMINEQFNNNTANAEAKDKALQTVIGRENNFKRIQNGSPVEIFLPLSGGAVRNII